MKVQIHISLKNGVLDPQGKAIKNAALNIGLKDVVDVTQGKYFEVLIKNLISLFIKVFLLFSG